MYTLIPGMQSKIMFSRSDLESSPYITIYAKSLTSSASGLLNYKVKPSDKECNNNVLKITSVKDKGDSCLDISVKYEGKGEIYVYAGIEGINIPTSNEVILNGIYIGTHDHSEVSTIYCSIIPNNAYIVYATAKDGECVHQLVSQTLTVKDLTKAMKFIPFIVQQYVHNLPSEKTRNGVRYRRYSPYIGVPTFFDDVNITRNGLLLDPMPQVRNMVNARQNTAATEEVEPRPATYSIEWFFHQFQENSFIGRFFVLGTGDVYIFNSDKKTVTILDVYTYGKKIGFFEEEAVEVTISNVIPKSSVYAILGYGEQFYGPFSVSQQM